MQDTLLIILLVLLSLTVAAPTGITEDTMDQLSLSNATESQCSAYKCLFGISIFNATTLSCECPSWNPDFLADPCSDTICDSEKEAVYSFVSNSCYCDLVDDQDSMPSVHLDQQPRRPSMAYKRELGYSSTISNPLYDQITTSVLPQPTDTSAIDPHNVAIISSVIPHFLDAVMSFYVQLNSPAVGSLIMNASTSFPCGSIGTAPEPDILLVPKTIKQGTSQIVIPDCQIIAVNMYTPKIITYWVQKENGSIFRLLGSNQIQDFDKIDTNAAPELAILTTQHGNQKRGFDDNVATAPISKRQIFSIACDQPCPFYHMNLIKSSNGYCGCMFKGANEPVDLSRRGIVAPGTFTATMTATACAAMKCTNNGGKAAVFNPFSRTCWCNTPIYVEENPSAWNGPGGTN